MLEKTAEFLDFNNFLRAWQKVADKQGCAGADGETIDRFRRRAVENIHAIRKALANGQYQPYPYQQVLIPRHRTAIGR